MGDFKKYLGDNVYADFDGYSLVLTTDNGFPDDPRNRIVLDPHIFVELLRFDKNLQKELQEAFCPQENGN